MNVTLIPSSPKGEIRAIASKSAAHRLLICAAFANAPTKIYYTGANTSGYVGASVNWILNTRTLSNPTINVSGQQSTGNMMVVYR